MQTRSWRQLALLEKFRGEGKRASSKFNCTFPYFPFQFPFHSDSFPPEFLWSPLRDGIALEFFSGIFHDECSSIPESDIH